MKEEIVEETDILDELKEKIHKEEEISKNTKEVEEEWA